MSPIILQIINYIQLAIKAAPLAEEVYTEGKAIIQYLFAGKLISKEVQDAVMQWADAHQAAALKSEIPPELTVEP